MRRIFVGDKEIKLKQMTFKEAKKFKKLGEAMGVDFLHCFYLANKYCEKFDEIKYYVIVSDVETQTSNFALPTKSNRMMIVEFYSNESCYIL